MIEEEFIIKNKLGFHLRPVNKFVNIVSKYKSNIKIIKGDQVADGKSVMDILVLVIPSGEKIKVIVDGEDENEAIVAIREFFNNFQNNL
ncbi:MAG: HPr family phosphocarrier protein [Elusimicrobiota bacterium]|nr:HPr family phosphocarrier protein [Endomicrobiia bacterium]MDW8164977.1 HPr family phosphocarrier protein [Elusimicrobiota bacterium]